MIAIFDVEDDNDETGQVSFLDFLGVLGASLKWQHSLAQVERNVDIKLGALTGTP